MLVATIAFMACAAAAEPDAQSAPQAARVDIARLLDAIELAPVRMGPRAPGPTRFGMHYWVDAEHSNNPLGVEFVILAVLADAAAARGHYDHLRARFGGEPLTEVEAARERFAVRFNADANATDVTLTHGNVYLAFRGHGERERLAALAGDLIVALGEPLIAPPGAPEPLPELTLARGAHRGPQVEVRAHWSDPPGDPLPRVVLYRPDGEFIAMADADGVAVVSSARLETVGIIEAVAGWWDNRWGRWRIATDSLGEGAPNE